MTKMIEYNNATSVRDKNKRTTVINKNNEFIVDLTILDGALDRRSLHKVLKGKAVNTTIKLSIEGAESLHACLSNELNRYYQKKQNYEKEI